VLKKKQLYPLSIEKKVFPHYIITTLFCSNQLAKTKPEKPESRLRFCWLL